MKAHHDRSGNPTFGAGNCTRSNVIRLTRTVPDFSAIPALVETLELTEVIATSLSVIPRRHLTSQSHQHKSSSLVGVAEFESTTYIGISRRFLHSHNKLVGVMGFAPMTRCLKGNYSYWTELHPHITSNIHQQAHQAFLADSR